jgi:hypothetical protein
LDQVPASLTAPCRSSLCQLPDDFATRTLENKALAVHACHEQDAAALNACMAHQQELASWALARVKKNDHAP